MGTRVDALWERANLTAAALHQQSCCLPLVACGRSKLRAFARRHSGGSRRQTRSPGRGGFDEHLNLREAAPRLTSQVD